MSVNDGMEWWRDFFDEEYIRVWSGLSNPRSEAEVDGLWKLLSLNEGSRVLDAPCGYGRISRPLAEQGATVVGVDQSKALIEHAEKMRGNIGENRLRYVLHDLRTPLAETGFDVAINLFSSVGYGTEDDDLAVFRTLHHAIKPGGHALVETMHRDLVAASISRGFRPAVRLPDGTLVIEEPNFDPIAGRVNTTWFWSGPNGHGQKSGSMRMYTATELVRLLEEAGFRFVSAHRGCSETVFAAQGPDMGGRLGLLCQRA